MNETVAQINGFPSDFINPEEKKEVPYCLAAAKAMYDLDNSGQGSITPRMRKRWETDKLYAEGNQNIAQYAADMGYKKDQEQGTGLAGYADIDFTPLGFMNKVVRRIEGGMVGNGHNIILTAIDPTSQKERKAYESMLIAKRKLAGYASQFGVDIIGEMYVPEDEETRMVYMKMGMKNAYEDAGEQLLKVVYNDNLYDFNVKPETVRNLIACGFGAEKVCYDGNGKIKMRVSNPCRMGVGYSTKRNFETAKYIFEFVDYSIAELKTMVRNTNIKEKDWEGIAKKYTGKLGNPATLPYHSGTSYACGDGSFTYDKFVVTVLEGEWKTVDQYHREKPKKRYKYEPQKNTYDEIGYDEKPKDGKKKVSVDVQRNYTVSWIVGSEFIYNYGPKVNQLRKADKKECPYFDWIICRVSPHDMHTMRSMAHRMKGMENMLQNGWNKLQNAVAHARIDQFHYDETSLMNTIAAGVKGVKNVGELIEAGENTGTFMHKRTDDFGNPGGFQPVVKVPGGIGTALVEYVQLIQVCVQLIRDITGVNIIADASDPDPRMGKAVAKQALDQSEKALTDLKQSFEYMLTEGANVVLKKIQRLLEEDPEVYEAALSSASVDVLRFAGGLSTREMGIKIENRFTDEEVQQLYSDLKEFVMARRSGKTGGINEYQYLMLRDMVKERPKFAQYWLGMQLEKMRKEDAAREKELVQMNAEQQQASNAQTAQNKQAEMQMKQQGEIEKLVTEKNLELRNEMKLLLEQLRADLVLQRNEPKAAAA